MLNKKLAEMNENGTLPIFKNYLANISANPTKVKSLSNFEEDGWYEVTDVDGFEKYLVYHYDTGKKISVRYIFGKTPKIQEANPKGFFGEIADVISVFAYDSTLAVSKLNTEEGSAVKLIGYDTEGNLVEDDIPEGIVVDDALNTESDNAIANAPVATALNEKADTADLLDGTLIPNKALQAKSIEAVSTESGAVQDTPFIYQGTGTANGTSIADTSPVGKHLEKQGNSVVVNQLAKAVSDANYAFSSASGTFSDGVATFTASAQYGECYQNINAVKGHVYYIGAWIKTTTETTNVSLNFYSLDESADVSASTNWQYVSCVGTMGASGVKELRVIDTRTENWDAIQTKGIVCIDLTQWFNGNIPQDLLDHPENFFRYYNGSLAYNAGSLENGTGRYLTCGGRNVWDEETLIRCNLNADYSITPANDGNRLATDYIGVISNASYYWRAPCSTVVLCYDADKNLISYSAASANSTFSTPSNCFYVRFAFTIANYGSATYNHDITISLYYETGDSYDQYFPYEEPKVYDTGNEPLYGIEGSRDIKAPNGTITRKMDDGKLEDLTWEYSSELGFFYTQSLNDTIKKGSPVYTRKVVICDKYSNNDAISVMTDADLVNNFADKSIQFHQGTSTSIAYLYLKDTSLNGDASLISGNFHYVLNEPTTEQGTPFAENIEINDYGTMGWDSEVPQGCKIFYPADYALFIDSVGQRQDINWDALAIVSHDELDDETDALEAKDTQLLNAVGGTLRQLLAVKETLDFDNTAYVDLGTLEWTLNSGVFVATISNKPNDNLNMLCTKYQNTESRGLVVENGYIGVGTSNSNVYIHDSSYADATAFKAAMKGVLLAYEKASE